MCPDVNGLRERLAWVRLTESRASRGASAGPSEESLSRTEVTLSLHRVGGAMKARAPSYKHFAVSVY